jgi:phosphoribosyl-ATP pyrophosphohydrolase
MSDAILRELAATLEARKQADPDSSYVARLYSQGFGRHPQESRRRSGRNLVGRQERRPEHLVRETADLWFHTLVMLAHQGLGPDAVLNELHRRFGTSGLAEKAARAAD